jgi:hypothetical protein
LFAVPPGDYISDLQSLPPDQIGDDLLAKIAGRPRDDIEGVLSSGAVTRLRLASCGRGAEILGVAVEVLITAGSLYGGYAAFRDVAVQVLRSYEVVRQRLGRRPLVSLGTARALAAAEVAKRLGHDDFSLLGSGDIATNSPDRSFTGEDAFWVTFYQQATLHVCVVEADGRVQFLSSIQMHDNWRSRFRFLYGEESVLPESDENPD